MTNTINVPRELLDSLLTVIESNGYAADEVEVVDELRALLSAPSPAGVDGLEVVAWQLGCQTMGGDVGYVLSWNKSGAGVCSRLNGEEHERALCRLSDAQAIIDGLRGENERIRLNIAEYNEAIACYQSERDQHAQRIAEMEGLLRSCLPALSDGGCAALANRIAAALSAGNGGE